MDLALEVNLETDSICLIDTSLATYSRTLILKSDIDTISNLFSSNRLYKQIIEELNPDQIIIALYYLLSRSFSPQMIIAQYFNDTGISNEKADELAELVYHLKLEILESDEIDYIEFIFSRLFSISSGSDLTIGEKSGSLDEVVNLLKISQDYNWKFDSISHHLSGKGLQIDLSYIKEALFEIEDKKHILVGLAVPYSSFLRNIACENRHLLYKLSQLVPIGHKDKTSIARALIENPVIDQILISSGFKRLDLYGITETGKLVQFQKELLNGQKSKFHSQALLIPLFLKVLK